MLTWNSLSGRGVGLAEGAQAGAGGQDTIANHEVGVAVKVRDGIQLGDVGLDEAGDLVVAAERSELGEPDRLVAADLVDGLEVREEGVGSVGGRVPVGDAEVVGAASSVAGRDPGLEPVQTLAGDVAVGDGRRADLDLAGVGVHVLDVGSGGGSSVQVGLGGKVRLVEAQDVSRAGLDGGVGVGGPAGSVGVNGSPQHGDVVEALGETVGGRVPVVSPRALLAAVAAGEEVADEAGRVVSETTLAASARGADGASGSGLGGSGRGGSDVDGSSLEDSSGGGGSRSSLLDLGGIGGDQGGGRGRSNGGGGRDHDDAGGSGGRGKGRGGNLSNGLLGSRSGSRSARGSVALGLGDGDPVGDDVVLHGTLVLVGVTVSVETHGLLGKSQSGSEGKSLLGVHLESRRWSIGFGVLCFEGAFA